MKLEDLGYNSKLGDYRNDQNLSEFEIGRIILEHKERYVVKTPSHEFEAELMGNIRFTAESRYDFPAIGDWVAFTEYDEGKALIHAIYPRHSILERKAVGKAGQVQIIAANIDCALIVQAVDRDFNVNRIERYLTICHASNVEPLIVLSKIDLIDELQLDDIKDQVKQRVTDIPVLAISSIQADYAKLEELIKPGKTYCLLGSSGVGKSTLLNALSGREQMKTGEISSSVNKGKHVTSHRELIVLESGGIIIDNPGMREVGIADTSSGLEMTFETILAYAEKCRYNDCTHMHEKDCAILAAVDSGEIDADSYANYCKMEKEKMHFESDAQERKKKDKDFGKMVKNVKKQRKNHKF